jgi:1,4-dihydroxy-2-naphthoyl-CoA synthase
MSEAPVLYEVADHVATLTLNRPAVRNAMNTALREAMLERLTALATDDAVRVIIVTGAGDKASRPAPTSASSWSRSSRPSSASSAAAWTSAR